MSIITCSRLRLNLITLAFNSATLCTLAVVAVANWLSALALHGINVYIEHTYGTCDVVAIAYACLLKPESNQSDAINTIYASQDAGST